MTERQIDEFVEEAVAAAIAAFRAVLHADGERVTEEKAK